MVAHYGARTGRAGAGGAVLLGGFQIPQKPAEGGRRAARAKSPRETGKKKPPGRPGGREEAKRRLRAAPRLLEAEPSAEAEDRRAQGIVDEAHAHGGVEGRAGASDSLQDEGLVEQVEAVHAQGQTEVLEGELLLEPAVEVDDVVDPVGVRRLELHLHRA